MSLSVSMPAPASDAPAILQRWRLRLLNGLRRKAWCGTIQGALPGVEPFNALSFQVSEDQKN